MHRAIPKERMVVSIRSLGIARNLSEFIECHPFTPRTAQCTEVGHAITVMKGRPVTAEEYERMVAKVPDVVGEDAAPSWRHYLEGLWWSGLRLAESLQLCWDRPDRLCVDLSGCRPMLRIPAELEKGNQDRLLPIAPEWVSAQITSIGRAAGVKVSTHPVTGKVKYASAHDLRRSFGERWAARVMPQVLKELIRHGSIETTLRFYVGRNAQTTAEAVWAAFEGFGAGNGNTSGNTGRNRRPLPVP